MIGQSFSHYRILHKIGEGGMGEVFLAHDTQLDRRVALKFLPAVIARDPHALARFHREAKAAAAVHHPNIITVHEVGVSDEVPYIAMAYVEGQSLAETLRSHHLPVGKAIDIASQVCDGLAEAHRNGIIHRDIKPGNIHIDKHDRARILDFGLALRETTTKITREGFTVGTIEYMSPEQATGGNVDSRSDIFSLGTVLYEMLAGQNPFQGPHAVAVVHAIVHDTPRPIRELNPSVDEGLAHVIEKALEKDPARRYASADEMYAALRAARSAQERIRRIQNKKRRTVLPLVAGVVVVAAAYFGWTHRPHPRVEESIAVLPFENLSGDPTQDYYVDGMTEAITTRLAQIKALRVISKTSATHYRNSDKTLKDIAGELNVTKIVRGSVTRSADRVRVTAQLIDAGSDNTLWAESYDSVNVANVIDLQSQVALEIASQVSVHVTPAERERLRAPDQETPHPQAYEAYLQGRYYFNRRTPQDITTALEYFKNAIAMDPRLARAFAGIADCYTVRAMWNWDTSQNTFPLARDASERALAIDPQLAEAHASLAMVELFYDWNWSAAEASFRQSIKLNPNYATAYHWYGLSLLSLGRYDDAIKRMKQACDLEPFSPIMLVNLSQAYDLAGQYQPASEAVDRAFKLFPEFGYAWLAKSWIAFHEKRYEDAMECARTAMRMHVDRAEVMLVAGLDGLGRREEAGAALDAALASGKAAYHVRTCLYAYHGDTARAIAMAREAISRREWFVVAFRSRWFEPLHQDPAFDALLKESAPIKGID